MEESAVNVQFKIEGPVFKKGIPLLEVTSALQEFHFILDKSYLVKTVKQLETIGTVLYNCRQEAVYW